MPIPANFAHIRQRDTSARLLTPITDVSTRKMMAIYRFRVRDDALPCLEKETMEYDSHHK
jgi:hypothetical protein